MNFGQVILLLKSGHALTRAGWNDNERFIYLVSASRIKQQDLRAAAAKHAKYIGESLININPHIDMVVSNNSIVIGWVPSITDMLSEDWEIKEV